MRSVAIHTGPNTHLDHLGPLCVWLGIPLIVTEESALAQSRTFYPEIQVALRGWDELSPFVLATEYDALFGCGKFWAAELVPLFALFNKKMRLVFCPHGNSDKGHSLSKETAHPPQDIALFYGDHMRQLLEVTGALEKTGAIVRTGNYRYRFYQDHRPFYEALAEEHIFSHLDRSRQTILYAPTWHTEETPSSFFAACSRLIDELSLTFNLVIKLHPLLAESHPGYFYHMIEKHRGHRNVLFLEDFPPIYPLLARTDIYLGDFSSIGYDFLAFDRPLYFLNPKGIQNTYLQSCGMEIPWGEENIGRFIETSVVHNTTAFAARRREAYRYTFGSEKQGDEVQRELKALLLQGFKNYVP